MARAEWTNNELTVTFGPLGGRAEVTPFAVGAGVVATPVARIEIPNGFQGWVSARGERSDAADTSHLSSSCLGVLVRGSESGAEIVSPEVASLAGEASSLSATTEGDAPVIAAVGGSGGMAGTIHTVLSRE